MSLIWSSVVTFLMNAWNEPEIEFLNSFQTFNLFGMTRTICVEIPSVTETVWCVEMASTLEKKTTKKSIVDEDEDKLQGSRTLRTMDIIVGNTFLRSTPNKRRHLMANVDKYVTNAAFIQLVRQIDPNDKRGAQITNICLQMGAFNSQSQLWDEVEVWLLS